MQTFAATAKSKSGAEGGLEGFSEKAGRSWPQRASEGEAVAIISPPAGHLIAADRAIAASRVDLLELPSDAAGCRESVLSRRMASREVKSPSRTGYRKDRRLIRHGNCCTLAELAYAGLRWLGGIDPKSWQSVLMIRHVTVEEPKMQYPTDQPEGIRASRSLKSIALLAALAIAFVIGVVVSDLMRALGQSETANDSASGPQVKSMKEARVLVESLRSLSVLDREDVERAIAFVSNINSSHQWRPGAKVATEVSNDRYGDEPLEHFIRK